MRLQVALSRPLSLSDNLKMKMLKSPESCRALSHILQQGVDVALIRDTWHASPQSCLGSWASSELVQAPNA